MRLRCFCRYPGDPKTYRVLMDCVDVDLLTMCQVLNIHRPALNRPGCHSAD